MLIDMLGISRNLSLELKFEVPDMLFSDKSSPVSQSQVQSKILGLK